MYKLLICGSRHTAQPMLDIAKEAVHRAQANGWSIVVGDAYGADQAKCTPKYTPAEAAELRAFRATVLAQMQSTGAGRFAELMNSKSTIFTMR